MLPTYELLIDETAGSEFAVDAISLVDNPAVKKSFLAFSEANKPVTLKFSEVNLDRGIISGVAMLADTPIYRNDPTLGECNVVISSDTMFKMVTKFFQMGFQNNFNIMHNPQDKCEGVTVFESFISDKTRGIQPMKGFEDAPDGSWFISAMVNNPEVKQAIIDGQLTGFSIEGVFAAMNITTGALVDDDEEDFEIHDMLDKISNYLKNKKNEHTS